MGSQDLTGEVAIVTGAAINTGAVIAATLAAAGAAVVVNYRSSEGQAEATVARITAAGGRAVAIRADVCDRAAVAALVQRTVEMFGPPTVLVNNANLRSFRTLPDITDDDLEQAMGATIRGTMLCIQACAPHMRAHKKGTIVNIGGGSGHSGRPNRSHVAAAKAGLAGLTGSLAVELAADNVTVNCIVPGRIKLENPHNIAAANKKHMAPMGRDCMPEEVANLIRFLCTDQCRYMTGNMLHVNGGEFVTIA
jgi:3-oxoacyl-[acyl-carrier protein] reductase